jgi:hypothetical protein
MGMHFFIRTRVQGKERPSFQERFAALQYIPPLLKLVWETHRGYYDRNGCASPLMRAGIPVAMLWVGKLIIDAVIAVSRIGPKLPEVVETCRSGNSDRYRQTIYCREHHRWSKVYWAISSPITRASG